MTKPTIRPLVDASDRRRGFSLRRQARSLAPLAALWLVGIVILTIARVQTAAPLRYLFLDPAGLTGSPWYTGAMSNLGILVWTAGVVFAVCGAWVARRTGRESAAKFLAVGAAVTLVLVLDDVFALHSGLLKRTLGISKSLAQLVVVVPTVIWLATFLDDILRTRSALLAAALASLAGSVLVDVGLGGFTGDTSLLIEDGMKFLGILAWTQYFAITSKDIAASAIAEVVAEKSVAERQDARDDAAFETAA